MKLVKFIHRGLETVGGVFVEVQMHCLDVLVVVVVVVVAAAIGFVSDLVAFAVGLCCSLLMLWLMLFLLF